MSMHVVGFVQADEKWQKMKSVFDACKLAGIDAPYEVLDYFGGEDPGDSPGMEIEVIGSCATEWGDDYRQGFQVDVKALPASVRFIRFYCSW